MSDHPQPIDPFNPTSLEAGQALVDPFEPVSDEHAEPDEDVTEQEDETTDAEPDESAPAGRRRRSAAGADKAQADRDRRKAVRASYKRALVKLEAIQAASPEERDGLALLLGVDATDTHALVIAALEARSDIVGPVSDLRDLAGRSGMDLAFSAMALFEKSARFKGVWDLVATVQKLPVRVPPNQLKAGEDLANAIKKMSPGDIEKLAAPVRLLG